MAKLRLRLVPRDESFFELFVRQAKHVEDGARVLYELITKFDNVEGRARQLRDLEHEGDEITHDIMRRLNTVFVTPLDHEDIHELSSTLDDVLDHIEAAADLFVLHKIERPLEQMEAQADVLVRAAETARAALERLPKYKELEPFSIEIDRLENEGDRIYRQAVAHLFEGDHRALDVLKLRDVCDEMEAAIDKVEDLSDVLETIALKHT